MRRNIGRTQQEKSRADSDDRHHGEDARRRDLNALEELEQVAARRDTYDRFSP